MTFQELLDTQPEIVDPTLGSENNGEMDDIFSKTFGTGNSIRRLAQLSPPDPLQNQNVEVAATKFKKVTFPPISMKSEARPKSRFRIFEN